MNPREYQVMFDLEDTHWWYRGLHDLVLRTVARRHRQKGQLAMLDAGCGTGRLCELLRPFGTVAGCDLSERALELARKRGLVNLFQADLNHADLGERRYDVITCLDVLYHRAVSREEPVLAAFYQALKPGGMLVVNLVAFEFLRSSHDRAVHTRRRYRRGEVVRLLRGAGFSVHLASYRLCLLFPFLAAYRLACRLFHREDAPETVASDVRPLPPAVNRALEYVIWMENRLLEILPLPFGLSVFVVAEKRTVPQETGEKAYAPAGAHPGALQPCTLKGLPAIGVPETFSGQAVGASAGGRA